VATATERAENITLARSGMGTARATQVRHRCDGPLPLSVERSLRYDER
jgi:hypothetical protein